MFPRLIASASVLAAALLPHQLELGGGMVRRSREIGGGSRRRGGRFCGHGFHLFDDLPRSVLWVSLVAVWVVSDRDIGSSGNRLPFVLEMGDLKASWGPPASGARAKYSRWSNRETFGKLQYFLHMTYSLQELSKPNRNSTPT